MLTASAGTDLSQPSASSSLLLVPGAVPATTRDHVPPSQGTDEAEEHAKKRKEKGKHKEVESAATVSHPGCAPAVEIKVPAEATISVQPPIATPHGAKVQVEIDEPGKEPLEIDVFIPPLESRVRPGELPAPLPIPLSEPAPEPVHAERKAEQEAVDASSVVPEASVIPESMNEDALSEMSGADAAEVAAKKKKKKDKKGKGGPEEGEGEDAFVPRFPNAKTVLLIRHGEKPPLEEDVWGNLNPKGYARAEFLAHILGYTSEDATIQTVPPLALKRPPIAHIYAPEPKDERRQRRMLQTVTPLSKKIGMPVDTRFAIDDPESVAETIATEFYDDEQGTVLVCWEHKILVEIAKMLLSSEGMKAGLLGNGEKIKWKKDDFDSIWVVENGMLKVYAQDFDQERWDGGDDKRKQKIAKLEGKKEGAVGLIRRMTSWVVGYEMPIPGTVGGAVPAVEPSSEVKPATEIASMLEGVTAAQDVPAHSATPQIIAPSDSGGLGVPSVLASASGITAVSPGPVAAQPQMQVPQPVTQASAERPVDSKATEEAATDISDAESDEPGKEKKHKKDKKEKKEKKDKHKDKDKGEDAGSEQPVMAETVEVPASGATTEDEATPRPSVSETTALLGVPGSAEKKKKKDKHGKVKKIKTLYRTDSRENFGEGSVPRGYSDEEVARGGPGEGLCCGLCAGCNIL